MLVLLFIGPSGSRAEAGELVEPARYSQAREGYVRTVGITGRVFEQRERAKGPLKSYYERVVTVENRLDLEVFDVQVDLGPSEPDTSEYQVEREHSSLIMPAHAWSEVRSIFTKPFPDYGSDSTAVVVSYRLSADPARTQGFTRTLFLLSQSQGQVDLAVAAQALQYLNPEAVRVRDEVREWVKAGPDKLVGEVGRGIASLYAIRLLGRVGTGEDVSLLLSIPGTRQNYPPALETLEALRKALPGHPMTELFGPDVSLERVAEDAVRDMQPRLAVPALVGLAYQDGPLRSAARRVLGRWKTEERVEALRGSEAEPLRVLCASRAPEALPVILGLGMAGGAGVDVRECLAAMPQKETNAALMAVLGEDLGQLEDTVFSMLAARSAAVRASLRTQASKLGLKVESSDGGALARAIHSLLRFQRMGKLKLTLDAVDAALVEKNFDTAMELLGVASREGPDRQVQSTLAVAYARVAQVAAKGQRMTEVRQALEAIEVPKDGYGPSADLESEMVEVARVVMPLWRDFLVDSMLDLVEARVGASSRPELARIYMAALQGNQGRNRAIYAKRALALDPSNDSARQVIEEVERDKARDALLRTVAIIVGGLLVLGLVLRFIVAQLREAV